MKRVQWSRPPQPKHSLVLSSNMLCRLPHCATKGNKERTIKNRNNCYAPAGNMVFGSTHPFRTTKESLVYVDYERRILKKVNVVRGTTRKMHVTQKCGISKGMKLNMFLKFYLLSLFYPANPHV